MLPDRLFENMQAAILDELVFLSPGPLIEQIILKTAKPNTIPTEDIAGLQTVSQQAIDQELVTICQRAFGLTRGVHECVALHTVGDKANRKLCGGILPERSTFSKRCLQKIDGFDQRVIGL